VSLGLATEESFPHRGTINFVDNQVNPKTGTLRVRGVFPNKDQSLSPGFFARVRVPIGLPHQALLVSDRALDTDQGQKILYAVNDKNEVVSRPIRVGALHDGLRAIEEGLKPFQSRKVMSVAGIEMGYNANEIAYPASMWHPGNKYVDWIGIDGYVGTGQNFNQVFRYQLRDIRRLTRRPIYLAETGVGDGAHEVAQIRNLFAGIWHWRRAGLVSFDLNRKNSWSLEGKPIKDAAYRKAVARFP